MRSKFKLKGLRGDAVRSPSGGWPTKPVGPGSIWGARPLPKEPKKPTLDEILGLE